jgi:hypothetical protein
MSTNPEPTFRGILSAFQADLGITNPCLSAASLSRLVELLVPLDAC